jgi:2,3-bisphosphoglycerate-dependent phosphoglycerate mutase
MQLYLIRHCQSENNALWYRTGSGDGRSSDPPLTELGHQQAQYLAQYIAGSSSAEPQTQNSFLDSHGFKITHLYCSLMRRSIETGLYIARQLDLPLVAHADIHERGGIYLKNPQTSENEGLPGPNREYFSQHFPSLILPDSVGADGWWNRPYEPRDAAVSRAESVIHWLLSTHDGTDDHVAMVIHGGFIQSLFSALFRMPLLEEAFGNGREVWIKANNGSIIRIDFFDETVRLTYQNRFEFIPAHLVT